MWCSLSMLEASCWVNALCALVFLNQRCKSRFIVSRSCREGWIGANRLSKHGAERDMMLWHNGVISLVKPFPLLATFHVPARLATKRFDLKFQEERQLDSSLAGLSLARNLLHGSMARSAHPDHVLQGKHATLWQDSRPDRLCAELR